MTLRYRGAVYEIFVRNPRGVSRGVVSAESRRRGPASGAGQGAGATKRGPRPSPDPRHLGLGYLRLARAALAGLGLAEENGEVETTTFGFCCLGFFGSRLLRRFF